MYSNISILGNSAIVNDVKVLGINSFYGKYGVSSDLKFEKSANTLLSIRKKVSNFIILDGSNISSRLIIFSHL
jgi:hypothetical protein